MNEEVNKLEMINAIAGFMAKATLSGAEVQTFNACMQFLQQEYQNEEAAQKEKSENNGPPTTE